MSVLRSVSRSEPDCNSVGRMGKGEVFREVGRTSEILAVDSSNMWTLPHARFLSLFEATPAGHAASAAHLLIKVRPQSSNLDDSIPQRMLLFSAKMMLVRATRSSMRSLPPLGLGGSSGRSGSIVSHSSSLTNCLAILPTHPETAILKGSLSG